MEVPLFSEQPPNHGTYVELIHLISLEAGLSAGIGLGCLLRSSLVQLLILLVPGAGVEGERGGDFLIIGTPRNQWKLLLD